MAFDLSEGQYTRLLVRVTAIEEHLNDVSVALDKFATLDQIQELLVVIQTSLSVFEEQVDALEARVTALEEEPLQ